MKRSKRPFASSVVAFFVLCFMALIACQSSSRAESRWALLIGVNEYQNVDSLTYAVPDVTAVSKQLVKLGYPDNHVILMTTTSGMADANYPSRKNILARLDDLAHQMKAGDTLFVHFSGHGFGLNGAQYLATADTEPRDLTHSAISLTELRDKIAATPARQVFFILDACRNDPTKKSLSGQANQKHDSAARRLKPAEDSNQEFAVFSSCKDGETSMEDPQLGHGVFTYYLLQALRGSAKNDRQQITVPKLTGYVIEKMEAWSGSHPHQTPWLAQDSSTIVLADNVAADVAYLDTLTPQQQTPANTYHPIQIKTVKDQAAIEHCVAVGSSVVFDLDGSYKTFATKFGVAGLNGVTGKGRLPSDVACIVLLDDKKVMTFKVSATDAEYKLRSVPIEDAKKLELRFEMDNNGSNKALPRGYICWLGEACFTNEGNAPGPRDVVNGGSDSTITLHLESNAEMPQLDLHIQSWQVLVDGKVQVPSQSFQQNEAVLHVEKGKEHKIVVRWHGNGYVTASGNVVTYKYRDVSVRFTLPVEEDNMNLTVRAKVKAELFNPHLEAKVFNENDLDSKDHPKEIRSTHD